MKALVVEKPGQLAVKDIKEPVMGEYDALCEQLYGTTCTGTDLHVIDGTFCEPVDYPSVIGHESIGRVIALGGKVRNYKIGDLITRVSTRASSEMKLSWGGMCQFGLALDHQAMKEDGYDPSIWSRYLVNKVIPEGIIDPIDAPMIITWRETLSYTQRIGIRKDDSVLLVGSGANGISIGAMAANVGAARVVMIGSASRKTRALAAGIHDYLDYRDAGQIAAFISKNKKSIKFIIDVTGKKGSLNPFLPCLAENGTVGVYGLDDFETYFLNPLLCGSFYFYNGGYDEPETHEQVIGMIRAGKLDANCWIDKEQVFNWDNAPEAYRFVREKKAIKAVIKLSI